MDDVADRLDQASDTLAALSRDVPTLAVAPAAFAALPAAASSTTTDRGTTPLAAGVPAGARLAAIVPDGDSASLGLPGVVGRALHDHWAAVLEARSREASSVAARLGEMARSVRTTRRHYAATDEAVERRFQQEF